MQKRKRRGIINREKRAAGMITVLIFLVLFLPFSVYGKEKTIASSTVQSNKIRVAYPKFEGVTDIDENGEYCGYTYEYLRKLALLTGWEYEFVQIEGDDNSVLVTMLEMLEKGEIDLMGNLLKNEKTEDLYEFAGNSYGTKYLTLSVPENENTLNGSNLSKKQDLKIGIINTSDKQREQMEKFLANNKINASIQEFETYDKLLKALQKTQVDAILSVDISRKEGTKVIAKFGAEPYYFATTRGNEEFLNMLNMASIQLENAEPYLQERLYEKYFGNKKEEFTLSEQELEYLSEKKEMTVLITAQVEPFQYVEDGEVKGIVIDILEEFAQKASLKLQYRFWDGKRELQKVLEEETYDLTLGVPYDYDYAENYNLVLSAPYVATQTTLFSKTSIDINDTKGKILSLSKSKVVSEEFKEATISYENSIEECIKAVERGDSDFGYTNSYSLAYYLAKGVYPNIITMPLYNLEKSYCCGFKSPADMQLIILFNRFIEQLDDNEMHNKIMGIIANVDHNMSIGEYIRINPTKTMIIFIIGVAVCVVIVFYLVSMSQKQKLLTAQKDAQVHFLSNMSHEMRTPLNTIVGLNDLAEENISDKEYVLDCIHKIDTASEHLLQLINDILDMSKISEGKMNLQIKTFDLLSMMKSIETVYQLAAKEKSIKLFIKIDEEIHPFVNADELRLKQVLINLLLNGIKYNHVGGEVLMQADLLYKEDAEQRIQFSVIDTGCGIAQENQKRIFNTFERAEGMEGVQGTGLGLAISNEILKLMDSELRLESKVGEGSRFEFTLTVPIANEIQAKEVVPRQDIQFDFSGIRFLLFEDNEINAAIVQKLLEAKKGIVDIVENGKIGCEQFEKSENGYYQIILMDIRMPVMDGYKATYYIRNLEREDAKIIPIFALSANAFAEDIQKSISSGMNEHLAKPIEREKLFSVIQEYIS